jgi:hypothetical protein
MDLTKSQAFCIFNHKSLAKLNVTYFFEKLMYRFTEMLCIIIKAKCTCLPVFFRALGVPVTDHSYDDCRLMQKAAKLKLPKTVGIVEFMKLNKKLG